MGQIWILVILLVLYFIPFIVGYNKRNAGAIGALNLLLGWTVIGWVVAFVWACTEDAPPAVVQYVQSERKNDKPKDDRFDKLKKLKDLLDSGAITEGEYNTEKQKILNNLTTEWNLKQ